MRGKLYILKPNDWRIEERDLYAPPGHLDIHSIVGGPIEAVPGFLKYNGQRCYVFCNEEGKISDPPLPVNNAATALWADALGVTVRTLVQKDVLVGSICIVTGDDELMDEV